MRRTNLRLLIGISVVSVIAISTCMLSIQIGMSIGIQKVVVPILGTREKKVNYSLVEHDDSLQTGREAEVQTSVATTNADTNQTTMWHKDTFLTDRAEILLNRWFPDTARHNFSVSTLTNPYLIENRDACNSSDKLSAIFLVTSAARNAEHRDLIRQTWGNKNFYQQNIAVMFVLGYTKSESLRDDIVDESQTFGDIILGNFEDTYKNVIHKTVLGLRWATEFCMNSEMYVKIDDDVFLNTFKFLPEIKTVYSLRPSTMFCYARTINSSPIGRSGKWKVPSAYFNDMNYFPFVHCNGFIVVIPMEIVPVLYKYSRRIPEFHLDDVWLTGILPSIVGNINVTRIDTLTYNHKSAYNCFGSKTKICTITAVVSNGKVNIYRMWKKCIENQQIRDNA